MTQQDPHPDGAPAPRSLARSAGIVGVATFLSRILGLVREQVFAYLFGASTASDAFNVAFRIPNLLRDLFAEGALSAAFVPTFTTTLEREGDESARDLARRVVATVSLIVGCISVAIYFGADTLVGWMAPGFAEIPGKSELAARLTRIMSPFLLLVALAAIAMGILNSLGRFFVPAIAPTMMNLGMILVGGGLALLAPQAGFDPILGMAIGAIVGGAGQLLIQLIPLARRGYLRWPKIDFQHEGVRRIAWLMAPATIGLAATQLNIFVNTMIASLLVEKSVSWLGYAFRLMQLPIGIFGVSIATVSLPEVSRCIARKSEVDARDAVGRALRLVFLLTMPASVGLYVLSTPIVALLYQHGAFTAKDTEQTAAALVCYSLGLVGYSAVKILTPVYYALGETRIPVRTSMGCVGLNILLNLALMNEFAHQGLALATSISGLTNALILTVLLAPRLGGLDARRNLIGLGKILIASSVMGLVCHMCLNAWGLEANAPVLDRAIRVIVLTPLGFLVYAASAWILGIDELSLFAERVRSRLSR